MQEYRRTTKVAQEFLDLVNQVFDIEKKASVIKEDNSIQRNINKLRDLIQYELFKNIGDTIGLSYHNIIGEPYNETRTDCDADIAGNSAENLKIIEVIKPIIYLSYKENDMIIKNIAQKAVVVAKSNKVKL